MQPIDHITKVRVGHGTHEGMTGKHNEDSYGFFAWQIDQNSDLHLAIVADGIGGQAAGERASTLAVSTIRDFFTDQKDVKDLPGKMAESIRQANSAIVAASDADPTLRGMGTTIVMTAIVEGRLYTAYVGDSRIYLLREGRMQQLTVDHTWAQDAIEAGLLTRQEAKTHPNRNVIKRYLGNANGVEVDHRLILGPSQSGKSTIRNQGVSLRPGDILILNSDGLSDMIDDAAIQASLDNRQTLQTAVNEMIDKANEAGGKDNITVVTVGIPAQDGTLPITKAVPAVAAAPAVQTQTAEVKAIPAATAAQPTQAWPWMVIAGILGILLLLVLGGGAAYFFFGGDEGEAEIEPAIIVATTTPTSTPAGSDVDLDERATASLRDAEDSDDSGEGEPETAVDPEETPGLVPTLAATNTATPTPRPVIPATNTPEPEATVDNSGGGNPPPPPVMTNTRPPTVTPPRPTTDPGSGSEPVDP